MAEASYNQLESPFSVPATACGSAQSSPTLRARNEDSTTVLPLRREGDEVFGISSARHAKAINLRRYCSYYRLDTDPHFHTFQNSGVLPTLYPSCIDN